MDCQIIKNIYRIRKRELHMNVFPSVLSLGSPNLPNYTRADGPQHPVQPALLQPAVQVLRQGDRKLRQRLSSNHLKSQLDLLLSRSNFYFYSECAKGQGWSDS